MVFPLEITGRNVSFTSNTFLYYAPGIKKANFAQRLGSSIYFLTYFALVDGKYRMF